MDATITQMQKNLIPTKKIIEDLINMEQAYINTNHPDFFGGSNELLRGPIPGSDSNSSDSYSSSSNSNDYNDIHSTSSSSTSSSEQSSQKSFFGRLFGGSSDSSSSAKKTEPRNQLRSVQQSVDFHLQPAELRDLTPREQVQVKLLKTLITTYFKITVKNVQDYVIKAVYHFLINQSIDGLNQRLVSELYDSELFDELLEEDPRIQVSLFLLLYCATTLYFVISNTSKKLFFRNSFYFICTLGYL